MKKLEFKMGTLINLNMELLNRYGVKVKARNFIFGKKSDLYYFFENEPCKEVKKFVWDYFINLDGLVMFCRDGKSFFVYDFS